MKAASESIRESAPDLVREPVVELPRPARSMCGLVLTAGGARGAYQAGVLKRVGEIPALRGKGTPFPIVAGASAGAINGAMIAGFSSDIYQGGAQLAKLWSEITVADVFRADAIALARNAARWAMDMTLGHLFGGGCVQSLLDASPLRRYLSLHLPTAGISEGIRRRQLHAFAVTATGYHSGKSFTFIQGQPGLPLWRKRRRLALEATIGVDHICASAAIPIVFAPVPLAMDGHSAYFGDGAMRLVTPLSPAIRLGADRLFAIGVRCQATADDLLRMELPGDDPISGPLPPARRPPLSQICGVFLNAIFLDHLDTDVDHLQRMNDLVSAYQGATHDSLPRTRVREPMRVVEPLVISPSEDLAIIAKTLAHRMPGAIRYLLDSLGTPDAQSADLMSYLLFDPAYTRELIQIGYRDAERRIDEIEAFLLQAASRRA